MQAEQAASEPTEIELGLRAFVERSLGEPVTRRELIAALVAVWSGRHTSLSRAQVEHALRARQHEARPVAARREAERARVVAALEKCGWNKVKAALELGMPRRTLYRRLAAFGLLA